ncbi:MAG: PKD repeat protein, partial [Chlorobi bacterium OLB5]
MKILNKTSKIFKFKTILLCAALILCCVNVFGQSITWERTYLRSNWTSGYSIKQTSDGNYITCGLRTNYGGFVLKLNRYGDTLWVRYFPVAEFTSIIETIDGKYVAIGWTDFVHIVKLDTNGNNIWARQIIEPGYETRAYHICLTNDGGFAIAGEAKSNNPTILSGYFLKLDSTGFKIWSKVIYKTNTNIVLSGVKEIIPAGFILTGGELYNNNLQIIVIKTLLNGDTLWTKSFGTNYDERGYAIFQTNDNGFLSIGQIYLSGGQRRLYFTKTDSTGILLWSKIYGDTLTTYELRSS